MSRVCTACTHPDRSGIDAAIVAGKPKRRIAAQYRLSEAAVRRHKAHVPEQVAKAHEAQEIARADTLLASIVTLRERLEKALETSTVAKDVASLARELRETLRLMLELEGRLRQGPAVQVNVAIAQSAEWLSLQARLLSALAPFPEARTAVLMAIEGDDVSRGVAGQRAVSAIVVAAAAAPGS